MASEEPGCFVPLTLRIPGKPRGWCTPPPATTSGPSFTLRVDLRPARRRRHCSQRRRGLDHRPQLTRLCRSPPGAHRECTRAPHGPRNRVRLEVNRESQVEACFIRSTGDSCLHEERREVPRSLRHGHIAHPGNGGPNRINPEAWICVSGGDRTWPLPRSSTPGGDRNRRVNDHPLAGGHPHQAGSATLPLQASPADVVDSEGRSGRRG